MVPVSEIFPGKILPCDYPFSKTSHKKLEVIKNEELREKWQRCLKLLYSLDLLKTFEKEVLQRMEDSLIADWEAVEGMEAIFHSHPSFINAFLQLAFSPLHSYLTHQEFKHLVSEMLKWMSYCEQGCPLPSAREFPSYAQGGKNCLAQNLETAKVSIWLKGNLYQNKSIPKKLSIKTSSKKYKWIKGAPLLHKDPARNHTFLHPIIAEEYSVENSLEEAIEAFASQNPNDLMTAPLSREELHHIAENYHIVCKKQLLLQKETIDLWKQRADVILKRVRDPMDPEDQWMLIAIAQEALHSQVGIRPNITQILTLLALIQYPASSKGRIAQVRTGEGKSTIIALLAFYLSFCGKKINIITSSRYLAQRDQKYY